MQGPAACVGNLNADVLSSDGKIERMLVANSLSCTRGISGQSTVDVDQPGKVEQQAWLERTAAHRPEDQRDFGP